MKNRLSIALISVLLTIGMVMGGISFALSVKAATPTTSVHIVKYAEDGITVIEEVTKTYEELESSLPVQGDGVTHYYTQGPTFDPDNLWDPDETLNLKDKGALMGTDVKDLCDLVGGMGENDTVTIRASDGYGNDIFPYANVYTPDPRQGKMVICWYNGNVIDEDSGEELFPGYVPDYEKGMLLAFFTTVPTTTGPNTGKLVFGHQDMKDCFPASNYHWYSDGGIDYPSTNGAYYKWVSEIKIYTNGAINWSLDLSGARSEVISRSHFENCSACHSDYVQTYTDDEDNTWKGIPLWMVLGYVDDTNNSHGTGCFNDNLYYDIKVNGSGDYSYTFASTDVARNNDYILANQWKPAGTDEFVDLPEDKFPLKLVNHEFTVGGPSVAGINSIELKDISVNPPTWPPIEPGDAEWPLKLYGAQTDTITLPSFESCASCHGVSYTDDDGTWSGLPLWYLMGDVDDTNTHGAGNFNDSLAAQGYDVWVVAADAYYQEFDSETLARNDNVILANMLNGEPLPETLMSGDPPSPHPAYPLKIVGSDVSSGSRVGAVVRIDLRNIPSEQPAWDLNGDGVCNIGDVVLVGLHWLETGTSGWIPEDLNNDGKINIGDVVVLGLYWGETW